MHEGASGAYMVDMFKLDFKIVDIRQPETKEARSRGLTMVGSVPCD